MKPLCWLYLATVLNLLCSSSPAKLVYEWFKSHADDRCLIRVFKLLEGAAYHKFKKFSLGCENFDDQVSLGRWISGSCYKPQRQIWWLALWDYQAKSASHNVFCHLHYLGRNIMGFWIFDPPFRREFVVGLHLKITDNFMCLIFTNHSARVGYDPRSIFKRSLTGLNSEFSFSLTSCLTKAALLFIHSWRENNWIHTFPKGISAMWNAVSSRIWTRIAVSISYDDNHYTTGTYILCVSF